MINDWAVQNGGIDTDLCDYNSIISEWFVDLNVGAYSVQELFFTGEGYYLQPGLLCDTTTIPCLSDWYEALDFSLSQILSLGYDYSYEDNGSMVRIWNTNCSTQPINENISINVGINFTITCNT